MELRIEDRPESRFSRFELISWWEQRRLGAARVLVVGAGALGNEIVKGCALAGIGRLLVADRDRVEASNLSRSVLFRSHHEGCLKAEVACEAAREIYPEMRAHPFCGDVVHSLGLGAYLWADLIIAGLDNREARVAVNAGAALAGKPWIDGAIEVLNGVARVFDPSNGPCYECTMSEADWHELAARRSCALLSREEMTSGRVPTTPTMASIIGGLQVQEAIKLLHGLDSLAGRGLVFSGTAGDVYAVSYPIKPDCSGHERFGDVVMLACSASRTTVGELLHIARCDLGDGAVVGLSRDVLGALRCQACHSTTWVGRPLGSVKESEARCPTCGDLRIAETLTTLGLDDRLDSMTLAAAGVPAFDVVTARKDLVQRSYCLAGDAPQILGPLAEGWPTVVPQPQGAST